MAKKSMIARDVKRKKMAERYAAKRAALMAAFNAADDPMDRLEIHRKIQALPVTVPPAAFAIAAGPPANPVVTTAISACAVTNCVSGPTKVNCPVL